MEIASQTQQPAPLAAVPLEIATMPVGIVLGCLLAFVAIKQIFLANFLDQLAGIQADQNVAIAALQELMSKLELSCPILDNDHMLQNPTRKSG